MAVGDSFAIYMGTAGTNRQPSAGVEEQVMSIVKNAGTDPMCVYNGTTELNIFNGNVTTPTQHGETATAGYSPFNLSIMSTNSVYIRKPGSTDRTWVSGVQTNA